MRKIHTAGIDFVIRERHLDLDEVVYCKTYDMFAEYRYTDMIDIMGEICHVRVFSVPFYGDLVVDVNSGRIFKEQRKYEEL